MILRSTSLPSLGALVAEDCCFAVRRSNLALFGINTASQAGRPLKPSLAMRRACSETDLQRLVCVADVTEDHSAGEKSSHAKFPCSLEKLSMIEERDPHITSPIDAVRPDLTKEDFQSRSRVSSGKLSSHYGYGRDAAAATKSVGLFHMASELSASLTANHLVANSEGELGTSINGSGHDGSGGPRVSSHGDSDPTDCRYRRLLQVDPENPLLLRNYAQYLSETKHDHKKFEEYYERAILACPSDGEVLSTYAKHVWDVHKDAERAGSYFDQAVKATPDDCYILASHASFLWQSEENEECNDALQPSFPYSNSLHTAFPLTASA